MAATKNKFEFKLTDDGVVEVHVSNNCKFKIPILLAEIYEPFSVNPIWGFTKPFGMNGIREAMREFNKWKKANGVE